MPAEELPSQFNVNNELLTASQFFERGIRYWAPQSNFRYLPASEDGTCDLSVEASHLLDGPLVERISKGNDCRPTEALSSDNTELNTYDMESKPTFECKFPEGITLVVDADWFRDI